MCLKQHARQVRTFRALVGYQPGLLSDRRDCNHLVHRDAASWAVSPVVSARSASVRHDTRPLRWGSMSHMPPTEVTRYAKVGCRWGAKQSCPRWSTVRGPSPSHQSGSPLQAGLERGSRPSGFRCVQPRPAAFREPWSGKSPNSATSRPAGCCAPRRVGPRRSSCRASAVELRG
jgi:hypothetical protein